MPDQTLMLISPDQNDHATAEMSVEVNHKGIRYAVTCQREVC